MYVSGKKYYFNFVSEKARKKKKMKKKKKEGAEIRNGVGRGK